MNTQKQYDLLRGEHGASLVEMALLLPMFMLLLFVAIDLGRAFYLVIEIAGAARAAAIYGSRNPTDTTGMSNAAKYDAPDVPNLSVGTPTYGCECSDGTNYSAGSTCGTTPTCSSTTQVYRVNVTVTATYKPLIPWPGLPSSMPFSSSASMRSTGS
jgi:Flp pilus assembly protein TadG